MYYTVKPGDTLSEIAVRFHVTIYELYMWNNIADIDKIYVGQVLKVRN
ncbi:peptidase P60 [Lactobacillus reuteri] [Lactiplantibacillus mudanjiangensis]|nr:peptidase P60 [Lactobacillus reuteri] [Lactiplantibacillus mudanjiangensis]